MGDVPRIKKPTVMLALLLCAEHGVVLGGESPLRAQSNENR